MIGERATSAHADGLLALFESAGSGCYCNYWHFDGDKNAWLERCYLKPDENRAALVERLAASELCGVVTRNDAGAICGWMKVMPAAHLSRLYDQRVYRRLPYFEEQSAEMRQRTYTIACMYVAEADRGRGAAHALLGAAIAAAKEAGARAIEAFPRGAPEGERLRPDQVWLGPEGLYLTAGFRAVTDFRAYPVLRLDLKCP
jgi:GNAT superfamily N-acetyltransferase